MTESLSRGQGRLLLEQDMTNGAVFAIGPGLAAVYSSRCPGKETPNEDAAALIPGRDNECVLAVADGLGGARAGSQASGLAVERLRAAVDQGLNEEEPLRVAILNGFEEANQAVMELGVGAATTLAVLEIQGTKVRPYHVGDSLILAFGQRGKIKLQTIPHSPVGYGVESGFLDEKEAMYHEERHVVSNVIGTTDMRIEIGPVIEAAERDTFLLASDGLSDNLHTKEIVDVARKGSLARAMSTLVEKSDLRMRNGGGGIPSKPDDLTCIMFRLKGRKAR